MNPGAGLAVIALAGYLVAAWRQRRQPRGWSGWRTASFATGTALLVAALTGPVAAGTDTFAGHMLAHLLIGMLAPLGLVLGAPLTLLLRTVDPATGRAVGRVLRSRPVHALAHPVTALALTAGGLYLLYLTPLYRASTAVATLHDLVHLHFLASGYLFAWVIAGPDPAPRRPGVPARLVVLGVAVVAHAVLSQLLYAGLLVDVPASAADRRAGAEIMYYGGDLAEILLALALLSTWRPRAGRETHGAAGHRRQRQPHDRREVSRR